MEGLTEEIRLNQMRIRPGDKVQFLYEGEGTNGAWWNATVHAVPTTYSQTDTALILMLGSKAGATEHNKYKESISYHAVRLLVRWPQRSAPHGQGLRAGP